MSTTPAEASLLEPPARNVRPLTAGTLRSSSHPGVTGMIWTRRRSGLGRTPASRRDPGGLGEPLGRRAPKQCDALHAPEPPPRWPGRPETPRRAQPAWPDEAASLRAGRSFSIESRCRRRRGRGWVRTRSSASSTSERLRASRPWSSAEADLTLIRPASRVPDRRKDVTTSSKPARQECWDAAEQQGGGHGGDAGEQEHAPAPVLASRRWTARLSREASEGVW